VEIGGLGGRIPYGVILRALGRRLDTWGWGAIRLEVRGAAIVLDGQSRAGRSRPVARRLALADELPLLLQEGRQGQATSDGARSPRLAAGLATYQERLRLLGQYLDHHDARLMRLIEHGDGLIVQRLPTGSDEGRPVTELLRWETLRALQQTMVRRRRQLPPH